MFVWLAQAQQPIRIPIPSRLIRPEDLEPTPWFGLGTTLFVTIIVCLFVAAVVGGVVWHRMKMDVHERAFRALCRKMGCSRVRVARIRVVSEELGLKNPVALLVSPRSVRVSKESIPALAGSPGAAVTPKAEVKRARPAGRVVYEGGVSRVISNEEDEEPGARRAAG